MTSRTFTSLVLFFGLASSAFVACANAGDGTEAATGGTGGTASGSVGTGGTTSSSGGTTSSSGGSTSSSGGTGGSTAATGGSTSTGGTGGTTSNTAAYTTEVDCSAADDYSTYAADSGTAATPSDQVWSTCADGDHYSGPCKGDTSPDQYAGVSFLFECNGNISCKTTDPGDAGWDLWVVVGLCDDQSIGLGGATGSP